MTGRQELKGSHGSRISLRGLFHSSSSSLNKDANESIDKSQTSIGSPPPASHRSFLRHRDSRNGTISPQSSQSSLSSFMRKGRKGDSHNAQDIYISKSDSNDTHNIGGGNSSSSLYESGRINDARNSFESSAISESIQNSNDDASKKGQNGPSKQHEKKHNHISDLRKHDKHDKHNKHDKHDKHDKHGSHLSLKRFLKKFKHTEPDEKFKNKTSTSLFSHINHTNSQIMEKYGPIGKFLGAGATGSVSLVTDKYDENKIYAVKKFRARFKTETENNYKTKVKNEFEIGFRLKHENIIHTKELIKESPKILSETEYYIIMEYCQYDFFNLVMSGLMDNNEKFCYFKQIVSGVSYLHSHGLAHRDLKLDNCVVNSHGILKLIDFGSAVYFKKEKINPEPTDDDIDDKYRLVRARGVVGSDPYLSPEVFEPSNFGYDPRVADIWSIAIVFCCMTLRRFPWKIPKVSDPSYKSFLGNPSETKNSDSDNISNNKELKIEDKSDSPEPMTTAKGSKKLLRLLPIESRNLISKMLILDPSKRYHIEDILADEFFLSIETCKDKPEGNATNHTHHLVTEEALKEIQLKNESEKKLKESGVA